MNDLFTQPIDKAITTTNSINIPIVKVLFGDDEVNSVDARTLHKTLESKQDFSNWLKAKVINNPFFEENVDYTLLTFPIEQTCNSARGGHNKKDYALKIDVAKKVAMAEQTERGEIVRDYFLDCEKKANSQKPVVAVLPQTYAEALRALADEVEEKQKVIEERDHAIKTKAYISTKREATLMGSLGNATKKINKLEDELGDGKKYKTVINIPWLKDYFPIEDKTALIQVGKYLTRLSASMKIKPNKVEGINMNVNSYHVDVISKFKEELDADSTFFSKYRIVNLKVVKAA